MIPKCMQHIFHVILIMSLIDNIQNMAPNLIPNSNFLNNSCQRDYCIWRQQFYNNQVNDWLPYPRIQIGNGNIYHSHLTINHKVIMLRDNTCVKKVIPRLRAGEVSLEITWAVKDGVYLEGGLEVYVNGRLEDKFVQSSYSSNINSSTIRFRVLGGCQILQLMFCGSNILLIEVKLFGYAINSNVFDVPVQNFDGFGNPSTKINIFSSDCIRKYYTLKQGYHILKFNYRAANLFCELKSYLVIYWNDQIITIYRPIDQSTNLLSFQIKAINGNNQLKFCPSVCEQQNAHHLIGLDNLNDVTEHFYLSTKYDNLVKNGDFQQSICFQILCDYLLANFIPSTFPYWYPVPSLQILKISNFIPSLPYTQVIDLDTNENSCSKTFLNLTYPGKYVLQFDWISRNSDYASMEFTWQIDGQNLQFQAPNDLFYHHQVYWFRQDVGNSNAGLAFCAAGTSDHFGVLVDNVSVLYGQGLVNRLDKVVWVNRNYQNNLLKRNKKYQLKYVKIIANIIRLFIVILLFHIIFYLFSTYFIIFY